MPVWVYAVSFIPGVLGLASMWIGGWALAFVPLFTFALVPMIELFTKGSTSNHDADGEAERRASPWFDRMLHLIVPLQLAIVGTMVYRVGFSGLTGWEIVGITVTAGMACGVYGINVAHELGHRSTARERFLAKALLLSTLYMHFFIEHNRGHHARVATEEDPASSRKGEWLYGFWVRSIIGGWRSAWRLERERLTRKQQRVLSWNNEMLRFQVIQLVTIGAVLVVCGPVAMGAFLVASLGGALMLETVNYIEHYGLARQQKANGRYERVRPEHSWNTNLPLGRALLFDLTRHADHHAYPARPYAVLRHFDEALQLPTGYPGMMVMSLVPPVFIPVMDRWIDKERARIAEGRAAA